MTSKSKPRYYKYVGPESQAVTAIGVDNNRFRKKEGYFVSPGEELLIKVLEENESQFQPISFTSNGTI